MGIRVGKVDRHVAHFIGRLEALCLEFGCFPVLLQGEKGPADYHVGCFDNSSIPVMKTVFEELRLNDPVWVEKEDLEDRFEGEEEDWD